MIESFSLGGIGLMVVSKRVICKPECQVLGSAQGEEMPRFRLRLE